MKKTNAIIFILSFLIFSKSLVANLLQVYSSCGPDIAFAVDNV